MKTIKWFNDNTSDLSGKTIAITGSTGKLMTYVVKAFASVGANLILINRNKLKTEQQIEELSSLYPNITIEFIPCNLSNIENVKTATKTLKQKHIDIIYLAAGVYNVPRFKTDLGFDNVFQTNFLSHYYIAKELMNNIKTVNGKIIAVSSIAHNYSKLDVNDIDFSTRKKHSKVYGNAKRFLTFALMELCQKEKVNFSIVHPGLTLTEMTNHYPKAINWLVKLFIGLFCPSTEKASLSLIKGVFDSTNHNEWIGPPVFQVYGKPKKLKLKTCSKDESTKIFEIAEALLKTFSKKGLN